MQINNRCSQTLMYVHNNLLQGLSGLRSMSKLSRMIKDFPLKCSSERELQKSEMQTIITINAS